MRLSIHVSVAYLENPYLVRPRKFGASIANRLNSGNTGGPASAQSSRSRTPYTSQQYISGCVWLKEVMDLSVMLDSTWNTKLLSFGRFDIKSAKCSSAIQRASMLL